jgi:hypothetical protein
VKRKSALILILLAQIVGIALCQAQLSNLIGRWEVEITFGNGEERSLRFEAWDGGTGSFLLLDPRSKAWGPAKPSKAKWTPGNDGSVLLSGPVEFPLGNIGRDPGTLVFKGKFGTDGTIKGTAEFFHLDQDPKDPKAKPSKSGSFKAVRSSG